MQGKEIDFKDGKARRLVFGVKQASLVEKEFDNQLFLRLVNDGVSFRFISRCVWAGLQRKNEPEISYDDACELIENYLQKTGGLYTDLLSPIVEACFESGVLRRAEGNGATVPNVEKETADNTSPSPSGGTISAPQSSATTA